MAVVSLLLGRGGSSGFPGKNLYPVMGRPLMAYPLMAVRDSKYVERCYVSTDSEEIMAVGRQFGAEIIVRPPELCTQQALGEDAYAHGYRVIRDRLAHDGICIELMVLLFANAATVNAELIDTGIETLRNHPDFDSAVTVSRYNMWSPLRARRLDSDGCLRPFVPLETFGDPGALNCDRDSQGDVLFADMSASIVRTQCLEHLEQGLLPQKWMGRRIAPIPNWGGCDVDYEWQIPGVEFWLERHGITPAAPASAKSTLVSSASRQVIVCPDAHDAAWRRG
jgi:CMP-N-acetylneuraminic acid synthetase